MDDKSASDWPDLIYCDAEISPGVFAMREVIEPERQQDG